MPVTPILSLPQVASNQNQKEVTINDAFLALENAGNAELSVAFTANAATLTLLQFGEAVTFLMGALSGAGTLTIPLVTRLFIIDNTANGTYPVTVGGTTGAAVFVGAGTIILLYCDGTNTKAISAPGSGGGSGGVTAFNTRTGPITLTESDVATALGFVPISSTQAVTQLVIGTGLNGGTITTTGSISLAPIAPNSIMANTGTGSAAPSGMIIGPSFTITGGNTLAIAGGPGLGTVTDLVAGGGLDGGSITNVGTVSIHGVGTATVGQIMESDGAGSVVWKTSVPAASGELLGGSGTIGMASGITIGANLTLAAGTLALDAILTGETLAGATLTGVLTNSGTIVGGSITGLSTPVGASDAATKGYVDGAIQGLTIKPSAAVATTAALPTNVYNNGSSGVGATLTASAAGTLLVDSYAPPVGVRVIVKNEATGANNGLYIVTQAGSVSTPWVLTRDTSMQSSAEFEGAFVAVEQYGASLANSLWLCTATGTVTIGTTAIGWTQLNSSTGAAAGTGLVVSGSTISLAPIPAGSFLANTGTASAAPGALVIGAGFSISGGTFNATGMQSLAMESGGVGIGSTTTLNAGPGITVGITSGVATISAPGNGTITEVYTGAGLTGGPITTTGTVALAPVAAGDLLANLGTVSSVPTGVSPSALLDSAFGANQGAILYRSATAWAEITLGTVGQVLEAQTGTPAWVTAIPGASTSVLLGASGTVGVAGTVAIGSGLGLATGILSLGTATVGGILANLGTVGAIPTPQSASSILDFAFGTSVGGVLYRGSTGWTALGAGTSGEVLMQGTTLPFWGTPTGITVPGSGIVYSTGTALADLTLGSNLGFSTGTLTLSGVELSTNKGANNGYAGLDSSGRVPLAQLPSSLGEAMVWAGVWNASTNSPTLVSGAGSNGATYTVSVAGTTTLDTISSWDVGDKASFDGTDGVWRKIDGLGSEVLSVAGRTGPVTLTYSDIGGLNGIASQSIPSAGMVYSNGSLLATLTLGSNLSYASGTLSLTGLNGISTQTVPASGLVYSNGTILSAVTLGAGVTFSSGTIDIETSAKIRTIPFPIVGVPAGGQDMIIVVTQGGTLLANGGAPKARVKVNPTATNTLILYTDVAGTITNQGTISISTAGVVTWPTFSAVALSAGDSIEIINQATADATFANSCLSLQYQVT